MIGTNGEIDYLPHFIQFDNKTQSFRVYTTQNAHQRRYEVALRLVYTDFEDTWRQCTTSLIVKSSRTPGIKKSIQLPDQAVECGQTFSFNPKEYIEVRKVNVDLGEAEDFLAYEVNEDGLLIHSQEHVLTGKHVGVYLIVIQNRDADAVLTSYLMDLTVDCV